jgi:hypothetical protein
MIGMKVAETLIATSSKYPYCQPYRTVSPTMNYPIADPMVPVPSIIPVTVETAFSFPLRTSYFPRSAAQAEDIKLFKPLMKKPSINIKKKKTPVVIVSKYAMIIKAIIEAKATATNDTRDLLP